MKKANIQDVANESGFSTATVSHVINNTRHVSDLTREKVLEAIEKLNYTPSSIARGLASDQTNTIGVIFSDISNPFFISVYQGIQEYLSSEGYHIQIYNTDEEPEKQEAILIDCLATRVAGIIIAPASMDMETLIIFKERYGIPIVLIDRNIDNENFSAVNINNEQMAFEAVSHLIADGHNRIGAILGFQSISTTTERLAGYEKALIENNIERRDEYIIFSKSRLSNNGYSGTFTLMNLDLPPTAIFSSNNLLTIGVLKACRELNLECPKEISIFGFDDHEWAKLIDPPLSLVRQPTFKMGQTAARLVVRSIKDVDHQDEHIILNGELVLRGSCSIKCKLNYMKTELMVKKKKRF